MKKVLVSPAEPASVKLKIGGTVSAKPEDFGVDFMWASHGKWFGVQRKRFPDDLMASLKDGRLQKELGQMQSLEMAFILLEGFGTWTVDGKVVNQYIDLDVSTMFSLMASITMSFGVPVYRVSDERELVKGVLALQSWTDKGKHVGGVSSLSGRPNVSGKWGTADSKEWALHFLQGMKGVGPVQAKAIYEHFGGIPMTWVVDGPEEFEAIEGIGKVRAKALWGSL
ncbi:hypothetical protein DRQ53_14090 [bacterium]|nr:MAG: hypothetical protein DRQ53_14090 [bacterium]